MSHEVFLPVELEARLSAFLAVMRDQGLDGIVVSVPENS